MPKFILEAEGHRSTIDADDLAHARDIAADFASDDVDPIDLGHATVVVNVDIKSESGALLQTVPIIFEPDEPPCESSDDELHDWGEAQRKRWKDGTEYVVETCGLCGMSQVSETKDGITHVSYDV